MRICSCIYCPDFELCVVLCFFLVTELPDGYNYDTSTVLFVTFVVNNHLHDNDNKRAMAWEKAMLDYLKKYKKHEAKLIDIEFSTEVYIHVHFAYSCVCTFGVRVHTMYMTLYIQYMYMYNYCTVHYYFKIYIHVHQCTYNVHCIIQCIYIQCTLYQVVKSAIVQ